MHCERIVTVKVRDGLHARPATQFVKLAKRFEAAIEVERLGRSANAKSSVKLMLLGIKESDEITLRADGEDAEHAINELSAFVVTPDAGLAGQDGEAAPVSSAAAASAPPQTPAPSGGLSSDGLRGVPASAGTALGPVFPFFPDAFAQESRRIRPDEIEAELSAYRAAVRKTTDELTARQGASAPGSEDAAILEALVDVAHDVELSEATEAAIRGGMDAVAATRAAGTALADAFAATADAYIAARAEDVRSLTRNVALALAGKPVQTLADAPPGAIILAEEIGAFDLAKADLGVLGGIVCLKGTVNSHVAIIARAYSIPLVVGLPVDPQRFRQARIVGLDSASGIVHLDPDRATTARIESQIAVERAERRALQSYRALAPKTRDGRSIEVAANLGTLKEIAAAREAGAMGVGLLRTEFLFMERRTLPTEDEQAAAYLQFAEAFAPFPVVVRTLDVGGDKPISGVAFPKEDNPFLGWRGVRMCLERLDIFKPQLKALLRAAVAGNIKVMVPMIVDVEEIRTVRALIGECARELEDAGVPHAAFELGIMMETPAAALLADDLAREVAFFSIGTNDLTQYIMAADRLNPSVAKLNRTDHPAVLKAVAMICKAARGAGIWVGICGEAAADPRLIPAFVQMGVTELSMSPGSILKAKKCITEL